jgi:uncharacterized protein with GYD domain
MPVYITLIQYTQDGIAKMKESPGRLEQAKQLVKASGGEIKAWYLTMGQYDAVAISEAPDDETYARVMLTLAAGGAIRSETLRAFTEEEYQRIVAALP